MSRDARYGSDVIVTQVSPEMNNHEQMPSTPNFEPNGHTAAENMEVLHIA